MATTDFDRVNTIVAEISSQLETLNQFALEPETVATRSATEASVTELRIQLEAIVEELRPLKSNLESDFRNSQTDFQKEKQAFEKEKRNHETWYKERKETVAKAQAKLNDDNAALEARLADFERAKQAHANRVTELANQQRDLDRRDGALLARVDRANSDFAKRKQKLDDRERALQSNEANSRTKAAFPTATLEAPKTAPADQAKLDQLLELVGQLKVDTSARAQESGNKLGNMSKTIDQTSTTAINALNTAGKIQEDLSAASSVLTQVKESAEKIVEVQLDSFGQLIPQVEDIKEATANVDTNAQVIFDMINKIESFVLSLTGQDEDEEAEIDRNQAFADRTAKAFSGIDELRRAVNDLRARIGSTALKRPSLANLTTSDSHKRRMSGFGQPLSAENSPTSEQQQPEASSSTQARTSSPLRASRENVDVEGTVPQEEDDARQLTELLAGAPEAIQDAWKQIEFAGEWTAAEKAKLLQFFIAREANEARPRYTHREAMDHCATSWDSNLCLRSYMLRKGHKLKGSQMTRCKNCMTENGLCVRVPFANEDTADYDPESTDKRWTLQLRR
ncbi:MAG: hypothetical protein LQ346_004003 [Caloplaca aetnensis]|nr:MAG: hypothetical protein LQ346_004003 [Caloplaca aetnensis]